MMGGRIRKIRSLREALFRLKRGLEDFDHCNPSLHGYFKKMIWTRVKLSIPTGGRMKKLSLWVLVSLCLSSLLVSSAMAARTDRLCSDFDSRSARVKAVSYTHLRAHET